MNTFTLTAQGPFALASSITFLKGFTPASYEGASDRTLELAFPVDNDWRSVGVRVHEHPQGVTGEIIGPQAPDRKLTEAVRSQVARILSLDVDGSGFPEVGRRDPVVAGLQKRYPGLRPVCFHSPYEAAAWAIIGQGIHIKQAAALKALMAERLGEAVSFDGDGHVVHAFPSPQRLAEIEDFPGLTERKPEWLRAIARAAIEGLLDAEYLRGLAPEQALAELGQLPGIGDFSAELVLLRGVGLPDVAPRYGPWLARAAALAYALPDTPTETELARLGENWKPYRTWVCLLLRARLEDEASEDKGRLRLDE